MTKKPESPFLKKANGPKPPNRRELKHGLGRGLNSLIAPAAAQMPPPAPPWHAPQPARYPGP